MGRGGSSSCRRLRWPAPAVAGAARGRKRRATGALMLAGIPLFALWAVLIDAYAHGWRHGPVPL